MSDGRERAGREGRVRVACLTEDEERRRALEELLRVWLPGVEVAADATLAERRLPEVDALVLHAPHADDLALAQLRWVRAAGFRGAVVVVVPPGGPVAPGEGAAREWVRLGGTLLPLGEGAGERLAAALTAAIGATSARGAEAAGAAVAALEAELWETRRRLAVADVAIHLQHALNNPLAALLAEAQLLEFEPLLPEPRASVRRMVELCRRMTETVRALDVARQSAAPPPPEPASPSPSRGSVGGEWFGHGVR